MRAALVLLMLAGPCWAEPWIDYELLLEQNADQVVIGTDASGVLAPDSDVMTLIDDLSSSQLDFEALEAGLAKPRLPVMNPCL